jgi:hypothetical protein
VLNGTWSFGFAADPTLDVLAATYADILTPNLTSVPSAFDVAPPAIKGPRQTVFYRSTHACTPGAGAVIAHALGVGFIPIRKQGKLPFDTLSEDYALEYGTATLQIHADACLPGARVLVVDDLIATGGSMLAACKLLQRLQASVVECAVLIDLPDLSGSQRLLQAGLPVHALCQYPGH